MLVLKLFMVFMVKVWYLVLILLYCPANDMGLFLKKLCGTFNIISA